MKGIIKNDILVFKASWKPFVFIFLVFFAVTFFTEHVLLFGNAVMYMIVASMIQTQHINDLSSGWLLYCNAAPVSRKDYIKSRYILMVSLLFAILLIFMLLFPLNPHLVKHGLFKYFCENVILMTIALITCALTMPVILKVKENTAKIAASLTAGVITGLSSLFSINLQFVEPHIIIIILCAAISLPLLCASYKISCKIYEGKDI